jgi:hypothetical protein
LEWDGKGKIVLKQTGALAEDWSCLKAALSLCKLTRQFSSLQFIIQVDFDLD